MLCTRTAILLLKLEDFYLIGRSLAASHGENSRSYAKVGAVDGGCLRSQNQRNDL